MPNAKKLILSMLLLAAAADSARADNYAGLDPVGVSTQTCFALGVSSQVPTMVLGSTTPAYAYVDILNLDVSTNVWCSDSVSVSTIAANALAGWKITNTAPGNSKRFPLYPNEPWYCLNDGVYSTTRVTVCKGR